MSDEIRDELRGIKHALWAIYLGIIALSVLWGLRGCLGTVEAEEARAVVSRLEMWEGETKWPRASQDAQDEQHQEDEQEQKQRGQKERAASRSANEARAAISYRRDTGLLWHRAGIQLEVVPGPTLEPRASTTTLRTALLKLRSAEQRSGASGSSLGIFRVTAYCPCSICCGKFADGVTATGADARTRGVAVDPRIVPLGAKLHVPGYGPAKADDVGGAIKGRRLDVRFATHEEALEWGVREIETWRCEEPDG